MTMTLPVHRPMRFAALILAGVALTCAGAYTLLTLTYPLARVATLIAAETRAATGRELRIDGGLSYRLLPAPAVVARDVALGNAPWGTRPDMATIRRLSFEIALRPLLEGELHARRLTLEGADLYLESDAQGRGNWQLAGSATPPARADGSAPVIDLEALTLHDARIAYRDGESETRLTIEKLDIQRVADGLTLAARTLAGAQSWQLEGNVGRLADLFAGIAEWPFALRAETAGARLSISGTAGTGSHAPAMRGSLSATFDDASALAPIAGNSADLPMPLVITATLERAAGALQANPLRISLGGQEVAGRIALREQDGVREIAGELSSSLIDLTRWPAVRPAPIQPENTGRPLFNDTPLPFAALPAISTHIRFTADRLLLPDLPALSSVSGVVRSTPGRFVLEPFVFALGDGQVASSLDITRPAGGHPQTLLAVDARNLPVDAVARFVKSGHMIKDGRIDLRANLSLQGVTPRAMASSSTGSFLVSVSNASLAQGAALEQNILRTLLQAIMPGRQPSDRLEITCAVLRLPLKDGVARIDRSIALETKDLAVAASGEVNLARETLTLVFEPQAKKGLRLGEVNLAQLVMLKGPLRDPKVGIDPKGAAQEAATLGIAVATGGLSLLAGRVLGERERTDACRVAAVGAGPRPAEHTGQRGKGNVADPGAALFKR
jgi:uncharacterized protein involved in outer membrane biogenesis